jgi:SAM-dependent methyltransferase
MSVEERNYIGAPAKSFNELFKIKDPWCLKSSNEIFRYKITLKKIIKFISGNSNILELGCAEGNFTKFLSESGYSVTSVDISEISVSRAEKIGLKNVEFASCDMITFVKNNNLEKFSCILLLESLYYLEKEKQKELINLMRFRTKSGTKIIISLPIRKNDIMFPDPEYVYRLFDENNFNILLVNYPVSLKGKSSVILKIIPSFPLKYITLILHRFILPFRLNQKLFIFEKK